MNFEVRATQLFLEQVDKLDIKARRILENKIILLKENPFRNKRMHYKNLFLFRVRFQNMNAEKRCVYLFEPPTVKLLCLLDRKNDYVDLKGYLARLGY